MEIVTNLSELLAQEEYLQYDAFSSATAMAIGLEACRIAREEVKRPVAVHVEMDGYPLFTHFMDGTDENNLYWVTVKKNVVKRFGHSSLYVGLECKSRGTTFGSESGLPESDYRAEGGSIPLVVRETGRVGSVTVSGLSGEEDHAVAVKAMRSVLS
jgi:uncharacterized protein (UPF0303 family)